VNQRDEEVRPTQEEEFGKRPAQRKAHGRCKQHDQEKGNVKARRAFGMHGVQTVSAGGPQIKLRIMPDSWLHAGGMRQVPDLVLQLLEPQQVLQVQLSRRAVGRFLQLALAVGLRLLA